MLRAILAALLCLVAASASAGENYVPLGSKLAPNARFCLHEYETGDAQEHCMQLDSLGWAKYEMVVLREGRASGRRVFKITLTRILCGNHVSGYFECNRVYSVEGLTRQARDEMTGWVRCTDMRRPTGDKLAC